MAIGWRLRDPTGSFILLQYSGAASRSGFLIGEVAVGSGNQSGSLSNPLLAEGLPFYFTVSSQINAPPLVTFSGNTLSWADPEPSVTWNGTIYYGVR